MEKRILEEERTRVRQNRKRRTRVRQYTQGDMQDICKISGRYIIDIRQIFGFLFFPNNTSNGSHRFGLSFYPNKNLSIGTHQIKQGLDLLTKPKREGENCSTLPLPPLLCRFTLFPFLVILT